MLSKRLVVICLTAAGWAPFAAYRVAAYLPTFLRASFTTESTCAVIAEDITALSASAALIATAAGSRAEASAGAGTGFGVGADVGAGDVGVGLGSGVTSKGASAAGLVDTFS